MNLEAAQIEMALLECVERQAERTAAALERVRDLMLEVAEMSRKQQAHNSKKRSRRGDQQQILELSMPLPEAG